MKSIVVRSPYPTDDLCLASKRMARKSVNRLSEPAVAKGIKQLNRLLKSERQSKLMMGDLLVKLIDRQGLRRIDIARVVNERANHLSEMYFVSKLFPSASRQPHVPYTHYWLAMRAVRKFKQLNLNPIDTLREIASLGLNQTRQVTAHFAARLRQQENQTTLKQESAKADGTWCNRCHHAPFQSLLNLFPSNSIKVLHADPPYANYRHVRDGRYSATSVTRLDCDNATAAEAIALTVDLLRDWGKKMKPGGVLLLWQSAGPLRKQIDQAVEEYGWHTNSVLIWDKGHVQAGSFEAPYSTQTEWLWVLCRRGDNLVNHNNSPRGDIVRFKPVHRAVGLAERDHAFEKPQELCEFLVGKHSYEGELVFDVCACTGTMSLAAAKLNRRWVYCESHLGNYRVGSERIARSLASSRKVAG